MCYLDSSNPIENLVEVPLKGIKNEFIFLKILTEINLLKEIALKVSIQIKNTQAPSLYILRH